MRLCNQKYENVIQLFITIKYTSYIHAYWGVGSCGGVCGMLKGIAILFLIFIYCGLFVLILVGFFCIVSSFTTFRPNFTSGLLQLILPRPRIGKMSLVTVFPVITAFHSCCLSHHVFDQVNLWPAWVGFETAILWQCSPGTVETLSAAKRAPKGDQGWIFWSYKSFLSEVAVKSPEEGQRWNLAET